MSSNGKNKRRQITCYDDIHRQELSVDSQEEVDTLAWLSEATKLSVINDFSYQPPSFHLFDSVKYQDIDGKTKTLFREHEYTPDWVLDFTPSAQAQLAKELRVSYCQLSDLHCSVFIDSKGAFNITERAFGYNQKWLWQKFKTYVYKLVPKKFFQKCGCPEACKTTKKAKKPRKMFQGFPSLREALKLVS